MITHTLKTLGHATLVVLEDGTPLIATDPWLIGSTLWRSWWLERYPTKEEVALVRDAAELYITHSHPDHFHWPTLRAIGPRSILLSRFPHYVIPAFCEQHGFRARIAEPWQWYRLGKAVRIASIPVPFDDSILLIDTPQTTVVNLNDTNARGVLLDDIRRSMLVPGKSCVVLKSYSPASGGNTMFIEGRRVPMKSKADYATVAQRMAERLNATHFVPFASQAFFSRSDSRWANDLKVTYEDLGKYWRSTVALCPPFITMDLATHAYTTDYGGPNRTLSPEHAGKVAAREEEEEQFVLPADFDVKMTHYFERIPFLRLFFRRGIGWRLASSGEERFYDTRTKQVYHSIPREHDVIITLPDKVLDEALNNVMLTDVGPTMFTRIDTRVSVYLAYGLFALMGLTDYGHLKDMKTMSKTAVFYAPYFFPRLWKARPFARSRHSDMTRTIELPVQ
jgi:L-ascorbate metabolism protein UlaG (beta-lactamase superfamily)